MQNARKKNKLQLSENSVCSWGVNKLKSYGNNSEKTLERCILVSHKSKEKIISDEQIAITASSAVNSPIKPKTAAKVTERSKL